MAILKPKFSPPSRRPMPRLWTSFVLLTRWMVISLLLVALLDSPRSGFAQSAGRSESEVKAAFIHKFPSYITWPEPQFKDNQEEFRIGVLASKEVYEALKKLVEGKTIHDRNISVSRSNDIEELLDSHVVYIENSDNVDLTACLDTVKGKAILTIGDSPEFADRGGIIGLKKSANKLSIIINVQAYKTAQLTISSRLLGLATLVHEEMGS